MSNNLINIAQLDIDTELVKKKSVDLKKNIIDLEVQMKDLKKSTNNLSTATDEEVEKFADLDRQLKSTRLEYGKNQKDLTAFIKIQEKEITTHDNATKSNKQLVIERALLKKQVDEISGKTKNQIILRKKLNNAIDKHTEAINKNSSEEAKRIQGIGKYEEAINSAMNRTSVFGVNVGGLVTQIKSGISALKAMVIGLATEKTAAKASAVGTGLFTKSLVAMKIALISTGIGAIILMLGALTFGFKTLVGNSKEFAVAQSDLKAVLGATRSEMKALTKESLRLGQSTAFTATEVLNLQTEFAKLGFPTEDIIQLSESTLNASAAMGSGLAETAKLTGSILKTYKLEASEASRVNDILADSTTKSALDFSKLENSMSTVGPVAKAYGFSLAHTITLLGTLSDAGFDASSSATATKNILLNLADTNGKLAKSLKEPVKDLPSLIKGLKQLSDEGIDLAKALSLTDKRSVSAFATFLNGTEDINKLSNALSKAKGRAKEIAAIKLDNLTGDVTKLESAWEGFLLSLEKGDGVFTRVTRNAVSGLTKVLGLVTELTESEGSIRLKSDHDARIIEIEDLEAKLNESGKKGAERAALEIEIANKSLTDRLEGVAHFTKEYEGLIKQRDDRLAKASDRSLSSLTEGFKTAFKSQESLASLDKKIEAASAALGSYEGSVEALKKAISEANEDSERYAKIESERKKKQADADRKKQEELNKEAVKESELRLQIFIAENKGKSKSLEDSLSVVKSIYEKELAIIEKKNEAGKLSDSEYILAKLNNHNSYLENQASLTKKFAQEEIQDEKEKLKKIQEEKALIKERETVDFENNLELKILQGESEFEIQQQILERDYQSKIEHAQKVGADTELIATVHAENLKKIESIRDQARLKETASMFGNVAKLLGENTAAGKAAGIAQATINTWQGVSEVWKTPSVLPEPFATISKGVNTGVVLASGLGAVREITKVKTNIPKKYTGGKIEQLKNGRITNPQNVPTQEGGDNVLIYAKRGETVINEQQERNAKMLYGPDVFQNIGVPGYYSGGVVGRSSAPINNSVTVTNNNEGIKEAVIEGFKQTKLVLAVDKVTDIQNEVKTIETGADV